MTKMKNFVFSKHILNSTFIILFFALIGFNTKAQNSTGISYSAKLDTNIIVIGDQINFEIAVIQGKDMLVEFPFFSDSIASGIEIISAPKQDTIAQENNLILVKQNYLITSFDGGIHKIAPLKFRIHNQGFVSIMHTDTLALGVRTVELDSTKGNFDIMMPYSSPITLKEMFPYILTVIGLILLGIIGFFLFRRWKNRDIIEQEKIINREPAHITALKKLDLIKEEQLWQQGKIKEYHSNITDTLRSYFDNRFNLSTMESTTDEIMIALKSVNEISKEQGAEIKELLNIADLAKFAKLKPESQENERSLRLAYSFVNKTKPIAEENKEQKDLN